MAIEIFRSPTRDFNDIFSITGHGRLQSVFTSSVPNGGFVRSDSGYEKFECLTYEHLTSYLDGTLERRALESCERHLVFCSRCSLALGMLKHFLTDEPTPEEINVIERVGPGRPFRFGRR